MPRWEHSMGRDKRSILRLPWRATGLEITHVHGDKLVPHPTSHPYAAWVASSGSPGFPRAPGDTGWMIRGWTSCPARP